MPLDIPAYLVQSFAGFVVQLYQRDAAACVGGAQHIRSGQVGLGHDQHRLHILVDGGGGQFVQHQGAGHRLGRAGDDEQNIQVGDGRTDKDILAR